MKRIGALQLGEGALIDARAICRDPGWQIRVCVHYDAMPLLPLPTGIKLCYIEKIRRGKNTIFKLFYPKIESMNQIPMWEWPAVKEMSAEPVAIVSFLEPTNFRSLHESMPEFPCRICSYKEQEKHDVCYGCNKILCHYMGKCLRRWPRISPMKIREQLIQRLRKVKINEHPKDCRPV